MKLRAREVADGYALNDDELHSVGVVLDLVHHLTRRDDAREVRLDEYHRRFVS